MSTPPTLCSSFRHSYSILSVRTAFLSAASLHFFPTYESNANYFRFKIAYSHESAIFCTVWQHTNLLFLQLLDYTTVGKIPSLCVIFLRTGNGSETFLGFCMEFFQSAVGIHPDTAETHGSYSPVQHEWASFGFLFTHLHSNALHTPCHPKEGLAELLPMLPLLFSAALGQEPAMNPWCPLCTSAFFWEV